MEISPRALGPFKFEPEMIPALANETIGHTTLERHPIVFTEHGILLVLPTAVSAAIRRFMIESAATAERLDALEALIRDYQFEEVRRLGRVGWEIREPNPVEELALEFIGRFDEGAYAHVVFLPDSLNPVLSEGLQSIDHIPDIVTERLDKTAFEIAKRPDYQRGMTLVIHGGAGRGFFVSFGEPPAQWERLALSVSDFMVLSWDTEMDALRAWKLLDRENELLTKRDTYFVNANGFMNLYGYAENVNYVLVPTEMTKGVIALATDYLTAIRQRLRSSVDYHAALFTKTPGYLPVQRHTTKSFFNQVKYLPIYASPAHMASAELLACVETETRPWWVRCTEYPEDRRAGSVVYQVWELVLNWLVRAAQALEARVPDLPPGPITVRLAFPEIDQFVGRPTEKIDKPVGPSAKIESGDIHLACTPTYLRSFASERNTGDRLMVEALIAGAYALSGSAVDEGIRNALTAQIVKDDQSRFFHTVPAENAREMLFAALVERRAPRFVQPEDRAASWLDLARAAGWTDPPGAVPKEQANALLNDCVTLIWKRIRRRLRELQRRSVVERAVSNEYAISRDGATWRLTAQALLSLYDDQAEIIAAANEREGERAISALSSRVICEMAICESPLGEGRVCTTADLDYLLANLSVLLECASQSDALHYGLVSREPVVEPNGTFTFDTTFRDTLHGPYIRTHGERGFRSAAAEYGSAFKVRTGEAKSLNPEYEAAFLAEFGLTPTQLLQLTYDLSDISITEGQPFFCRQRSDVMGYLNKVGAADAERAYAAMALKPRKRWDESKPENALQRDWYPWRFNRRLSLTRRPIVQLELAADPAVVIAPALVDRSAEFFISTYNGRLPGELFDSAAMTAWIGKAVDAEGHAFNKTVASAYKAFGFEAREVYMTELGGTPEMGDVDAFAWDRESGVIYATECKRLLFARTVAEVRERLQEYTSIAVPGDDRTPIQKHLDRMAFLRSALPAISKMTGIPAEKIIVRSGLVTDYLVPMQFSEDALKLIDLVTDLSLLESAVMARQASQF
jgi:hypothetical protein